MSPVFDQDAKRLSRRQRRSIKLGVETMNVVVNQINLAGNVTRDPEVRFLPSGIAVTKIGLAVNNRIKKGDEWVDDTCFVDVTIFGKQAEWAGENLDKGNLIFVNGRLQFRSWEKDGQRHSKHEVVAEKIILLVNKGNNSSENKSEMYEDNFAKPYNSGKRESKEREVGDPPF